MNTVDLLGRLGGDVELRYTQTQKAVASFSVAVRRDSENTDWVPVVAWENTAKLVAERFRKGDMIAVTGRLQSRKYTDKEGKSRNVLEVVAQRVFFTGNKSPERRAVDVDAPEMEPVDDDGDLPF